jgi:hypothetical protein
MWRTARLPWLTYWLLQSAIPAIKAKLLCRSLLLLPAGLLLLLASGRAAAQTGPQVVHLAKLEIYPEQLASYQAALKEHIETALRIEPGVLTLYPVAGGRAACPHHRAGNICQPGRPPGALAGASFSERLLVRGTALPRQHFQRHGQESDSLRAVGWLSGGRFPSPAGGFCRCCLGEFCFLGCSVSRRSVVLAPCFAWVKTPV